MSRRNGKLKQKYPDILQFSSQDDISLSLAVEQRFIDLCGSYLRVKGIRLVPPSSLDADMFRWRQMAVRYKKGDFRHTQSEMKSLRIIAEWTLQLNAELRNQTYQPIEWRD